MDQIKGLIGLILLGMAAWAAWRFVRAQAAARAGWRAGYLADCATLFTDPVTAVAPSGFARMSGTHHGDRFDIQVLADTLTYRKLPCLWLLVTLPTPMPVRGTLDIMLRPSGMESFSNHRNLSVQVTPPAGFPADCTVRTDAPQDMLPPELVAAHIARLDGDRLKEIVVSPKGTRIVWLAEQAHRGRYLLFRDAEMGQVPLAPAELQPLLTAVAALRDTVVVDFNAKESRTA